MSEAETPKVGDVITQDGPVPLAEVLRILSVLIESHDPNCNGHAGLGVALDAVLSDPRVVGKRRTRKKPAESEVRRGTRIPPNFLPTTEMTEWASKEFPLVNSKEETDRFIDFWASKPGQTACKLDWNRTWKNWIRSANDRIPQWRRDAAQPRRRPIAARDAVPIPQGPSWYDDPVAS